MTQLEQEHKNAHLIAVEDVMRQVRLLAGWGQSPSYIKEPVKTFDRYYEMSIEELHNESEALECAINKYVSDLHPPQEKPVYRELREDEQDSED